MGQMGELLIAKYQRPCEMLLEKKKTSLISGFTNDVLNKAMRMSAELSQFTPTIALTLLPFNQFATEQCIHSSANMSL